MCGIVGSLNFEEPVDLDKISEAVSRLRNRGPDDYGIWSEENVGLGHNRLSILDLSPAGNQPMLSADGRYVIVHNGEIYNFRDLRKRIDTNENRWTSDSDTEVILAAYAKWGADCVKRFHGMFAFAIFDRREKKLFAARDRIGVKPFYYSASTRSFLFASRPQALRILSRSAPMIDEQALRLYLEIGYIPSPRSTYRGFEKLPPAHWLSVDEMGLKIERYWDYRQIEPDRSLEKRNEKIFWTNWTKS